MSRDENWVRHPYQIGALMDKDGNIKKIDKILIDQPADATDHFRDPQIFNFKGQYYAIVGDVVALSDVNDPVFSSGAMGQGIAVKPSQDVVYAPADAEVSICLSNRTRFWLETTDGAEVLTTLVLTLYL